MTVKELINKLGTMPPEAVVVFDQFSEVQELDDHDVKLVMAEDKKMVLHEGGYMDYRAEWYGKRNKPPQFATVVRFPGN